MFTDRVQQSIFGGFEFQKSVFLGIENSTCIFVYLDKLNKCCILIVLYFQCYFWVQCYLPGTSVNTIVHHTVSLSLHSAQLLPTQSTVVLGFCFS